MSPRAVPVTRILIVGYGSIGRRHARNLSALGLRALSVCEPDPSRRAAAQEDLCGPVFADLEAALDDPPDVVFVCTPPASHISVALEAAQRGCHLFIEKPLCDRLDGVDRLEDEVRPRNLITMVGCNLRFHPTLRKVKDLLEERAVGRPVAIRAEVGQYLPDWHPWEDYRRLYSTRRVEGGGVILDSIHELDYVRWMMGEVSAVACIAGHLTALEMDTEDTAAVLLRFASGAIGEVHLDYVQRPYSRTCQVIGEEGTIRWDYSAGQTRWYAAATGERTFFDNPSGWDANQMYVDEIRHFLACLTRSTMPMQDIFEGRRVLEIALAAKESAQGQRFVVMQRTTR